MPRWIRVVRGMVGTGLTFAAGVGALCAILGVVGILLGELTPREVIEVVAKVSVVSFIVGVAFSGALAISARGRPFDKLSLRFVTALGAGVGLLYFLLTAINGVGVWSLSDAIANFAILTLLGGGSAAGTLILARKARRALRSGDDLSILADEGIEAYFAEVEAERQTRGRA